MNTINDVGIVIHPSHKQRRYLELARRQAYQSEFNFRHGCVLVKGGQILNAAFNKVLYSSFATRFQNRKQWRGTKHAEIGVILGLDYKLTSGADVYVVRVNNFGDFLLSSPCPMCRSVNRFVGIRRIIYSIDNDRVGIVKL